MTAYIARCYTDHSDTVTATRDSRAVWLEPSGPAVGLEADSARTFARGILALADEIDGGEARPERRSEVQVGDRVEITVYRSDESDHALTGLKGTLRMIDNDDIPYLVDTDEQGELWAAEVQRIDSDPASVAEPRRLAALMEAQKLTSDGLQYGSPLAIARFLLGE